MTDYSQNGYTANDRSLIASYEIPGAPGGKVALRTGSVATVLLYIAQRFNAEVETLRWPGNWGYAERLVRGSSTDLSNHASGTAMDDNAPQHPLGTLPSSNFSSAQIAAVHRILNTVLDGIRVGNVVRWGGDYTGRKDGMHFEINAGPASVVALANAIKGTHPPKPKPKGPYDVAKVVDLQALLELNPDGFWGPTTDEWAIRLRTAARAHCGYPHNVVKPFREDLVQRVIDTTPDNIWGPHSQAGLVHWVKALQKVLGVKADGVYGPATDAAFMTLRKSANGNY